MGLLGESNISQTTYQPNTEKNRLRSLYIYIYRISERQKSSPKTKGLLSYSRYRDDCFIVWTGEQRSLYTMFQYLNSLDPDIQFTLNSSYDELDFLDVRVSVVENRLETEVFTKPTAGHLYLHPHSSHPPNQIKSIPFSQGLRLNRNTSNAETLKTTMSEFTNHFLDRGYNKELVESQFSKAEGIDRKSLLETASDEQTKMRKFPLVVPYSPKLPHIGKIFRKHIGTLHSKPELEALFPLNNIFPAFKRNKNLKEILAPSRFPRSNGEDAELGCKKTCQRGCDLCSFLTDTATITNLKTKEKLKINHKLTCKSRNVIYVLKDRVCNKQYVGSTKNMKERLSNYKSQIKQHVMGTCNVVTHWWATGEHTSVHPVIPNAYSDAVRAEMSFTLVDQVQPRLGESLVDVTKRLRNLEGGWEQKLDTLHPYGLNIRDEGRKFGGAY